MNQTIVIIPGLDFNIEDWKISKSNHQSIYHYLEKKYNIIDLTINNEKYKLQINDFLDYINTIIPNNSYLLAHSFGSVIALLFAKNFTNKVKGILLIDPSSCKETFRINRIKDETIKNNLLNMLQLQTQIKYLNKFPIISHVIFPFKKLSNPDKQITDENVFEIFNQHFSFLKHISHHPKSNIILHPNVNHNIHQVECEKIKCNIDYLLN
jgi:predicted alpha/beta hydrolase family esterase